MAKSPNRPGGGRRGASKGGKRRKPTAAAKPPRVPSYCHHAASGQAYVKLRGKVTYLGVYGSEASRAAYAAVVADVLAERPIKAPALARTRPGGEPTTSGMRVGEVCQRFTKHAASYYVKNSKPTAEAGMVANALDHAAALFGDLPVESFGPVALKAVRQRMVAHGLARTTINGGVNRIRRAFNWAAGEELIPASVPTALATVAGLRAGRTEARETAPVLPVDDLTVDATVACLPEVVADMVRLQRLTGMRPGEVCDLRPCDLDRNAAGDDGGEVWTYRPESHKTQHHGRGRVIFLGPKAQAILLKYLARDAQACCFRPCDSEAKRRALAHALRTTPLSCGNRPGTNVKPGAGLNSGRGRPGEKYTTTNYRQAITRACERAKVAPWTPNQLRHAAATEVRAKFGLEAAL